jgi:hypothetical protein
MSVALGCTAARGEPADLSEPSGASTNKSTNDENKTPRPEFEAGFEGTPDAGPGTGGDPTPPNSDQCLDPNDPGGSENVAKQLPETDDCDNAFKTVNGVANGSVDVDVYKLSGTDKTFCNVDADFNSSTAGLELCVYARCKNSTANAVTGCSAGTAKTNSNGLKGCCATTPGKAIPTWDCSGITDDDSADFVISVKQVNGEKCLPYKLQYHF